MPRRGEFEHKFKFILTTKDTKDTTKSEIQEQALKILTLPLLVFLVSLVVNCF